MNDYEKLINLFLNAGLEPDKLSEDEVRILESFELLGHRCHNLLVEREFLLEFAKTH